MGWSVIGATLSLLALLAGCAPTVRPDPSSSKLIQRHVIAVYDAVARGDESAYRDLVHLDPRDGYSNALTVTMFASIHLHQAVEQHLQKSRPATRPGASLAAVDYRENARAMIKAVRGWTFTVHGDRATIDQLAGQPGAPSLRRARDGRWLVVPTAWDTPRDTAMYRLAARQELLLAAALTAARDEVVAGRATSVEDVNAILRNLLTLPTTQP